MEIARLPFVFVIDVDGTLVGDVSQEICLSDIVFQCGSGCRVESVYEHIKHSLRHGLARPHFITFYKTMKEMYKESEFFIYTASTKKWTEILINLYETQFGISFRRPLFTREFCGTKNNKDIEYITPYITKSLRVDYPTVSNYMIRRRTLVIDNHTPLFSRQSCRSLIKCPSYTFKVDDDIVCCFPEPVIEENYKIIARVFKKHLGIELSQDEYNKFSKDYHDYLNTFACHSCDKYKKDLFWLKLACFIASYDLEIAFSRDVVADYNVVIRQSGQLS